MTLADIGALGHVYVNRRIPLCQAGFLLTTIMASSLFLSKRPKMGRMGVVVSRFDHKSFDFMDRGLFINSFQTIRVYNVGQTVK